MIDDIRQMLDEAEELLGGFMGTLSGYKRAEALRTRIREYLSFSGEGGAEMSEWISTKIRMPNPGQFVFAYGDACQGWVDGPKMAVFRWWNDSWWDANMDAELADGVPTHWMPLPEPPEQPSGDTDA